MKCKIKIKGKEYEGKIKDFKVKDANVPEFEYCEPINEWVSTKVTQHNTAFEDLIIPEGFRLFTLDEGIKLLNDDKWCKKIDFESGDNDFFVQQPFKKNKDRAVSFNYYYGQFLILGNYDLLYSSGRSRGVLFVKEEGM